MQIIKHTSQSSNKLDNGESTQRSYRRAQHGQKFDSMEMYEQLVKVYEDCGQLDGEIKNLQGADPEIIMIIRDGMRDIQQKLLPIQEKCQDMETTYNELEMKCHDLENQAKFGEMNQNKSSKDVVFIEQENEKLKEENKKLKQTQDALSDARRQIENLERQLSDVREENSDYEDQLVGIAKMESCRNDKVKTQQEDRKQQFTCNITFLFFNLLVVALIYLHS